MLNMKRLKLSKNYIYIYDKLNNIEFEKPSFACYETFKKLNADLGYNLVLYPEVKRGGLKLYGPKNPVAIHSHYKLDDILNSLISSQN